MEDVVIKHTALSDACSALALLAQFPTKELIEGLANGGLLADFRAMFDEAGLTEGSAGALDALAAASADFKDEESGLSLARREYTRLFNHPEHPAVLLYEGVFLDQENMRAGKKALGTRLFINPAALDAERCYRQVGLVRDPQENIPADCMYTELEFLAFLHTSMARAALNKESERYSALESMLEEFTRIHVDKWFGLFFARCVEEGKNSLYTALGYLGLAVFHIQEAVAKVLK